MSAAYTAHLQGLPILKIRLRFDILTLVQEHFETGSNV